MELVRCMCVFDDEGSFCPAFNDTKQTIEGDQVIMAIGQASDLSFLEAGGNISTKKGLIVVKSDTLETGMEGVYAGGDVVEVPGAIIHAVAAGRKAASAIDKALGGSGDIEEVLFERGAPNPYLGRDEGFASWPRIVLPELELNMRHQGFQEVALGYTEAQAMKEASRCLQCDLRLYLGANPSPPEKVVPFDEEHVNEISETEGVFQLYDADRKVIAIKGTPNLRESLWEKLEENEQAAWFDAEEDKMYSKRESELIQEYLQEYGEMPGGGDSDLDDLF
jgi:formate dehydrogenase beta subunit